MPATYEPISTVTLGTAAASITLNSIPGTYTDLRLVFNIVDTGGLPGSVNLTINGSSSSVYSITRMYGTGSGVNSNRATSASSMRIDSGSTSSSSGKPNFYTLDFLRYAGSQYKTVLVQESADWNGSGYVGRMVGLFQSTSAITSLTVTIASGGGNMAVGTSMTLYGIKGA